MGEVIMVWTDWIPAISTSSVLAVIGIVFGTYYKAKVEKAVQHNFDQKLEELRAKLRRDEEEFKADLRSKDDQIAALRSGALSGMVSRQAFLDKRRLEAIEKLWSAVIDRWSWKNLAKMVGVLNTEETLSVAAQQNEEGRKLREFADMLYKSAGIDLTRQEPEYIDKERPFLPPIIWALFSAYRQILNLAAVQITVMRTGANKKIFADPKPILDMVKAALPHYSEYIDQYGTSGLSLLIDELEETLLAQIVAGLESTASDDKTVNQAAAILTAVENVAASTKPEIEIPNLSGLRA
jgi:hypothetical protein